MVTPTAADLRHARLLWDYLRLGIPVRPAECLLVFGGHDIGVASRTAELYGQGMAAFIVVSGGSRAVPDGSHFLTEADAIADVVLARGVPKKPSSWNAWPRTQARTSGCRPNCSVTSPSTPPLSSRSPSRTPSGAPSQPPSADGPTRPSPSPPSRSPSTST